MAERTISNFCSMLFGDFFLFSGGSRVSFIDTFSLFFFLFPTGGMRDRRYDSRFRGA
jgi:hypothetical protein